MREMELLRRGVGKGGEVRPYLEVEALQRVRDAIERRTAARTMVVGRHDPHARLARALDREGDDVPHDVQRPDGRRERTHDVPDDPDPGQPLERGHPGLLPGQARVHVVGESSTIAQGHLLNERIGEMARPRQLSYNAAV